MSKIGGVFQIDDVTRTMSKGGGAPGVPPIQVQTPPTWLAGYGPVMYICTWLHITAERALVMSHISSHKQIQVLTNQQVDVILDINLISPPPGTYR